MAKNTQEAEVIVTLNGQAAKRAIDDMTKEYNRLTQAALDAYKAGNDALGKELDTKAQKLTKDIEISRREVKKFGDVMKNINGASLKELRSAAKQLQNEINKLAPGTQEFINKSKQLQQVNTRINQLRGSFKGLVEEEQRASFSLKGIADGFNKYFGIATASIAALTGVSMAFRKCAEEAAKLDDVYADVMKTTGLMHDEVASLDKELMKINTRTSREQLLLLARDAGKLGIQGKENILGFVRAADQIQVALGEDLGEGAIRNLGKIADVLGYTQNMGVEKALLSIGSAVNAVGQASTASESYLVEFTQRLAGVGQLAHLSAANIIGFASGLDQSSMKVEMAATAFQKFMMKLYADPAKFAEYAKMSVEEFAELMKNDANSAMLAVLQGLKDIGDMSELTKHFDEMGLDGARTVQVLGAMASNLEAVTNAQALANVEFERATSISEEYNTKNNSRQAQLEKARKEFQNISIELGQKLSPVLLKSTKGVSYLIRALVDYGKEIKAALVSIAALTVAVKATSMAHAAYHAILKSGKALKATYIVVTKAMEFAFARLSGRIVTATKAYLAMKASMSASVFGVIASAVAVLTIAISNHVKKMREAAEAAEWEARIEQKVSEEYSEQAGRVKALTAIVENNNIAIKERKKALEELRSIVPGYHAELTEEGKLINANRDAIEEYCKSLRKQIRMQAYQDKLVEVETQIANIEERKEQLEKEAQEALIKSGGDATEKVTVTYKDEFDYGIEKSYEKLTDYGLAKERLKNLQEQELNPLLMKEASINEKIGNISKTNADEKEKSLSEITKKYNQLFKEIREQNYDNPERGEALIEQLREEQRKEIEETRKRYESKTKLEEELTTENNTILTQAQFDFIQERYDKLNKKEKAMVDAGYASLSDEDSKALKARYDKLMKTNANATDKLYQQELKNIQQWQRYEQNDINRQYFDRSINTEKHEEELRRIKMESLQKQLELAQKYGKDTTQIEASILDEQVKNRKADYEKGLKPLEQRQKEEERTLKRSLTAQEITQEQYDTRMLEIRVKYLQERLELAKQNGQDETAILQAILDAQVEAETLAFEQIERLKKQAKDVKAGLSPKMARGDEENDELKKLDSLHDAKLLSEEEYEQAVSNLHKKYAQANLQEDLQKVEQYTQQVNSVMQEASNFVGAMKEAELAKAEATYQAQLTAAGDNAEQREQIEADYENKKLEIQKRYADVDMGINIAKAIAAGALAAIKAVADLGPIAGPVAAGLIAATTAAEVATIVAQRNAIKNSSANSPASSSGGSSGSSQETGTRVITGYSEGGNTQHDASDKTPVGIVHANEWVAPAWMVRENPVVFKNLEEYRRSGSRGHIGKAVSGFAEGGFSGSPEKVGKGIPATSISKKELEEVIFDSICAAMDGNYIHAVVVRKDIDELNEQDKRFKAITSRGSVTGK